MAAKPKKSILVLILCSVLLAQANSFGIYEIEKIKGYVNLQLKSNKDLSQIYDSLLVNISASDTVSDAEIGQLLGIALVYNTLGDSITAPIYKALCNQFLSKALIYYHNNVTNHESPSARYIQKVLAAHYFTVNKELSNWEKIKINVVKGNWKYLMSRANRVPWWAWCSIAISFLIFTSIGYQFYRKAFIRISNKIEPPRACGYLPIPKFNE